MSKALTKALSRFKRDPAELIPALQAVQGRLGYLPRHALERVAQHCRVPESTVFGVASFYQQFHLTRQGRHSIKVCLGTGCHILGGAHVMQAIQRELGIRPGETTSDYKFTLERIACFGACALAPVIMVDGKVYGHMTAAKASKLIGKLR